MYSLRGSNVHHARPAFALPFVAAQALLLALYWLAQSLIALSVRDDRS